MAKQNLPSVDGPATQTQVETKPMMVTTEPAAYNEGYVSRRVDVKLTRAAALILRDKLRQLQDSGAKTANGQFVTSRTQAVQWIIENSSQIDR